MRFSKWFGRPEPIEIKEAPSRVSEPEHWLVESLGATPVSAGVSVNPNSAMQCAAVACAVKAISETIGQLPIHVYERGEDGSKERAPGHPVSKLVHDEVSEWCSSGEFRETLQRDALLHEHGAFAVITRLGDRPVELHHIPSERVTVDLASDGFTPFYKVALVNGSRRTYGFSEILHLRGIGSPIRQAREAIGLAIVMEQHAARLFSNGARPGGVISYPNALDVTSIRNISANWRAAFSGQGTGKAAILDQGATYSPITLTSVDAQFMEMRAFAIAEIARAFRVPPTLLMDYGRATWGNSEAMGQQFLTYTLMPWIKRWEAELRLKLFSPTDRETFFAEFLVDDLLRGDFDKRAKSYAQLIAARVLNPNECRAMENRPPYEGGDEFLNPNTTPAPLPPSTGGMSDEASADD